MTQLRTFSGKQIVRVLKKLGYREGRMRGSHMRLHCEGRRSVTVPGYKRVGVGLFRKILRDAEISLKDFTKLLEK